MKTTLRKFFVFKYTECDALKEYLEEMAQKGWLLKDINTYLTFEKAEPQKLIYSVEVFEKASIFDTRVEEKAKEYIDYCHEAGWQFVCSVGKTHVFVATDENAIPIETDETLKYHTIRKSMLRQNAIQWFAMPLILILNTGVQYFYNFEHFIANYIGISTLLIFFLFFIIIGSQIISFCIWCKRARRNLANGQALPSYNQNDLKRRSRIRMIPTGLILIAAICMGIVSFINTDYYSGWLIFLTVGIIALVWGVSIWFQKSNLSRATNILLPIVLGVSISGIFFIFCIVLVIAFSHENPKVYVEGNTLSVVGRSEIPLKLEDVGITPDKYRDTDKHVDKTVFAQYTSYYDNTQTKLTDEAAGISYSLFESKYSFIINHYMNYNISKSYENYKPSDASIWDAKKAFYSDETHRYMVVYENCIFLFESDLPFNNKALTTIKEKLNLKEFVNAKAIGA